MLGPLKFHVQVGLALETERFHFTLEKGVPEMTRRRTAASANWQNSITPASLGDSYTGRIVRITFCTEEQIRIRKIVSRSRMRETGKYPSWKTGRMHQWESPNENNAFFLLDYLPQVLAFREQPCEIVYVNYDGVHASHFPDVEVDFASSRELWEVKPEKYANREPFKRRTEILTAELPAFGFTYQMKTAEYLALEPRQENIRKLLNFGRRPLTGLEREHVRRELAHHGSFLWSDCRAGMFGPCGREIACRLVLEGYLELDINSAFNENAEFRPLAGGW
jgi:hypothetical protein